MAKKSLQDETFAALMSELSRLEQTIEQRELDDLDQLMEDVERAESIIEELRKRLESAQQKIEQNSSD